MTTEQIKQTVAEIKSWHKKTPTDDMGCVSHEESGNARFYVSGLLEITDHLQKTIEAQAAEINRLKIALQEPSTPWEVI